MIWVLVIFIHAGAMSNGDSMTMTTVEGFQTEAQCKAAGEKSESLVTGTVKALRFTCLQKTK